MAAARRIDDSKIDSLAELVKEQGEIMHKIAVSVARIEERLKSQDERIAANTKEIDNVKSAQRWVVLTVLGAFLTSIVNFFFRGGN